MNQTSLNSEFEFEKTTTTTVKYKMTVPLKRCKKCKEWKPKSEFRKCRRCIGGLSIWCKSCADNYNHKYHAEHIDDRNKYNEERKESVREWNFLHFHSGKWISGLFCGQGICLICGELHPLVLENHHVLPDCNVVLTLCSNCHSKFKSSKKEKHMIAIMNAIENSKFLWRNITNDKIVLQVINI